MPTAPCSDSTPSKVLFVSEVMFTRCSDIGQFKDITSEVKSSSTVKFAFPAMFYSALKLTDLPPGIRGLAVWP